MGSRTHGSYDALLRRSLVHGKYELIQCINRRLTAIPQVEYTFGRLIPTLLMVESSDAILFQPLAIQDPDAPINKATDPELMLAKPQPITASFRSTIRHLQSKGGFRARFRGISMFIVYTMLVHWISAILNVFIPFLLAPIIATVVCAQLSVAWTHLVISDPSPKPWYRRIPSIRTWKKVAGPTAMLAVAHQIAIVLPAYVAATFNFLGQPDDFANTTAAQRWIIGLKVLSIFTLSLALAVLVVIPANVTLIRMQASVLPDEVESVVPFDRSFGGKVVPEIVGGSGIIGMLDAWKTFDRNARVRLFKAYAKVFAMQLAIAVLFFSVIGAEVAMIVGKNMNELFPGDGKASMGFESGL
jgi:hypothetical protein